MEESSKKFQQVFWWTAEENSLMKKAELHQALAQTEAAVYGGAALNILGKLTVQEPIALLYVFSLTIQNTIRLLMVIIFTYLHIRLDNIFIRQCKIHRKQSEDSPTTLTLQ